MPRGKRTEAEVAAARTKVVEAARAIIAADGLARLTARRLASELGWSVGSIYTHYRTLDEVVRAATVEEYDRLAEAMRIRLTQVKPGDARGAARAVAEEYMMFSERRGKLWAAIFEHMPSEPPPDWYMARRLAPFALVEEVLRPFAGGGSAAEIARELFAAIYGVEALSRAGQLDGIAATVPAIEIARNLVDTYLDGLEARTGA